MKSATLLIVILSVLCFVIIDFPAAKAQECPSDKDKDWSWDKKAPNGPAHWGEKYPDCKGRKQSPININRISAEWSGNSDGLHLTNYDKAIKNATIKNVGYLVIITPTDGVDRSVKRHGKTFTLREFHFHWGNKVEERKHDHNSPGSEHSINKRKYSMEIHLAHYDEDDNIVVVAAFLEESYDHNPTITAILKSSEYYQYSGDETEVSYKNDNEAINLDTILQSGCPYYTYEGSNTFPPCKEGVTWMICTRLARINIAAVFKFEKLYTVEKEDENADKCHMVDIFRPIQPLNDRTVYYG